MSKLAADGIPTAVSLRALLLPRQPSYRWRHQQVTTAELIEAYPANALLDAHRKDPELQKNVSGRKRWRTREELRITIITRIERTYHRRRRQARLGLSTSIEYGTIMNPVALAACPPPPPQLSPDRAAVPTLRAQTSQDGDSVQALLVLVRTLTDRLG